jgi:hypothetical protein
MVVEVVGVIAADLRLIGIIVLVLVWIGLRGTALSDWVLVLIDYIDSCLKGIRGVFRRNSNR